MVFKIITAKDGRKVILRSIVASDLKRVNEFTDYINSIIAERDFILLKKKVSVGEEKQFIKNAIAGIRNESYTFVLECEGKIIGTATVAKKMGVMDHVAGMGLIVREGYRGIGIGSEIMKQCIATAKKKRCKYLRLEVFSTNKRAIGLYKKFGFKQIARIPKQIQRRGKLIDEIIMIKQL